MALDPCPSSPNCVCSLDKTGQHAIAPLSPADEETFKKLKKHLLTLSRVEIVKDEPHYIHAIFRTFLGFPDDVEFEFSEKEGVIHMRSASRYGYYDFGKNRARLKAIARALYQ